MAVFMKESTILGMELQFDSREMRLVLILLPVQSAF